MKTYKKLVHPKDSAWERKTWRRYTPIWFNKFIESLTNLIDWFPVIWKDRHWDDYYITKVLQRKIELQRQYLISHNRHIGLEIDNRDMTWLLNLIERKHHDYYAMEKYDYEKSEIDFTPSESRPDCYQIEIDVEWENWDEYLDKYKGAVRRVIKQNPKLDTSDKSLLALYVGKYNQKRCDDLVWKIMSERSDQWWD
jgi:hypothetical protein